MIFNTSKKGLKNPYLLRLILVFSVIFTGMGSCKQNDRLSTVFQLLDSAQTNIHFQNKLSDSDYPGILNYLYFYNGGGVAIGDINNDGLPDIFLLPTKKAVINSF